MHFHVLLATVTRAEELALDEDESNKLAQGMSNVARHYNVEVAAKTTDWISLALIAGGIYAPRLTAIRLRAGENKRSKPREEPAPAREVVNVGSVPEEYKSGLDMFGMPLQ